MSFKFLSNQESIKENVYQILQNVYESKMKPVFGYRIGFNSDDDLNEEIQGRIQDDVLIGIMCGEPRISDIDVMTKQVNEYLYVNVSYKIISLNQRDQLEIPFLIES